MTYQCPPDFDRYYQACHAKCPPGFKFNQTTNNKGWVVQQCVLFNDNSKTIQLENISLWAGFGGAPQDPAVYEAERKRIASEAAKFTSTDPYEDDMKHFERASDKIASQYAGFQAISDAGRQIRATTKNIREPRPPVQPNEIRSDTSSIINPPKMLVIQTALFTILLGMVELLVIPAAYVQGVLFLTLCVGAAAGIYLSNT